MRKRAEDGPTHATSWEHAQAHALVLSTASLVFFKMFTSGFRESLWKRVELHDTTETAVHTMLAFLVTGMLSEDEVSTLLQERGGGRGWAYLSHHLSLVLCCARLRPQRRWFFV